MSAKEFSVLFIGFLLVAFLYVMKHPSAEIEINTSENDSLILETSNTTPATKSFSPETQFPIYDKILDIPAWNFDLQALEALTSDELVKAAELALQEQRYFQPENDNALFYLINLKSLDPEHGNIKSLTNSIKQRLQSSIEIALEDSNETLLKSSISRLKSLGFKKDIKTLQKQLSVLKTINKLYDKGSKQLQNNQIANENSEGAWHTAKQGLSVDSSNSKAQLLASKVNGTLINSALRAAEEIDFELAQELIEKAALLIPNSMAVELAQSRIQVLKQQRINWLQQQLELAISNDNLARAKRMFAQLKDMGISLVQLEEHQANINRLEIYGKFKPFDAIRDKTTKGQILPKMIVMPTGRFIMGSQNGPKHEKPAHQVNINYGFAVSQNEISIADFKLFIQSTSYVTDAEKNRASRIYDIRTGRLKNKYRINWQKNYLGKRGNDLDPVIHVSWNDAIAYTKWLSEITSKKYRLLSEAEFEYVQRAGSSSFYPWGDGSPSEVIENLTGKLDKSKENHRIRWKKGFDKYNDKYWGPAPVGSFISNPFKINDISGNVMEWVMDCWHDSYTRAPLDGRAWINPGCQDHVIRGGGWSSSINEFSSTHRLKSKGNFTDARLGFRIALDLK